MNGFGKGSASRAAEQAAVQIAVRTWSDPAVLSTSLRREVEALDKDQPLFDVATMEARLADSLSARKFNTGLLATFSGLGLVLAAVGIYGVLSYMVSRRTPEIGVRSALGATPADILRLVLGEGLALAFTGIALGIMGSLVLVRFMSSWLSGTRVYDPLTIALMSLVLLGTGALASYVPARRAARLDPMLALRDV